MPTTYTSLLGLALPATGELAGTWGTTVNDQITSLLDSAIAGTTTINTDADITLTTTTGGANQSRQAIILWTANGTVTRNITAPAASKTYVVINASAGTQSIVIRGVGPTAGVTVLKGERVVVAWNGSDFVKVSSFGGAGTFTDLTVTGNTILGDAAGDTITVNGATTFTNVNPTLSAGTANGVLYLNGSKAATSGSALTWDGTNLKVGSVSGATVVFPRFSDNSTVLWVRSNSAVNEIEIRNNSGSGENYLKVGNGYLAFGADAGEAMRLNSTGLGIGTNNPGQRLDVSGADGVRARVVALAGGTPGLILSSSGNTAYTFKAGNADNSLRIDQDGNDRITLASGGNLGLGTSSPSYKLDITAPNDSTARVRLLTTTGYNILWSSNNSGGTWVGTEGSVGGALMSGTPAWASVITSTVAAPICFGTNTTERMRLDSSGNLGIGTGSPGAKLDVVGSIRASSAVLAGAAVGFDTLYMSPNGAAGNGTLLVSINNAQTAYQPLTTDASVYIWRPNGAEQMRLTSTGLGIGTSSPFTRTDTAAARTTTLNSIASFNTMPLSVTDTTAYATGVGGGINFRAQLSSSSSYATYAAIWSARENGTISDYRGSLVLATTDNALGYPVERARIDSSGNLLVGNTSNYGVSETNTLQVKGAMVLAANNTGSASNRNWAIQTNSAAAGALSFAYSSTNTGWPNAAFAMTLDSSGNLGLGVTPSAWSLATAAQVGFGAALSSRAAGSTASDMTHGAYWNGTNWLYQASSVGAARYQMTGANAGSTHAWFISAGGTAGNTISFTQAMTLDANNNLLVGTTSTAGITGFSGSAVGQAIQSSLPVLALVDSDDATNFVTWLANSGGAGYLYTKGAYPFVFGTNGNERARITDTGNVVAGGSVALATTATDGFLYVPTCAGVPTGTPTAITGMAPIVVNTTNNKLYFYSGGAWRDAGP